MLQNKLQAKFLFYLRPSVFLLKFHDCMIRTAVPM